METVINQAMRLGMPPNVSDAHTINGKPGPAPNCSSNGMVITVYGQFFGEYLSKLSSEEYFLESKRSRQN